jgi:hypothetical protein
LLLLPLLCFCCLCFAFAAFALRAAAESESNLKSEKIHQIIVRTRRKQSGKSFYNLLLGYLYP